MLLVKHCVFGMKDVACQALCVRYEGCCLSSNILHTEHIVPGFHSPDPNLLQYQNTIPHAVNLSLTLLKMVKKLPETCWAVLGDQ